MLYVDAFSVVDAILALGIALALFISHWAGQRAEDLRAKNHAARLSED